MAVLYNIEIPQMIFFILPYTNEKRYYQRLWKHIFSNCALMLSIKPRASKFINCMNQQLGLIIKRPKLISTHGKRQVRTLKFMLQYILEKGF